MRGIHIQRESLNGDSGATPTYAGNTKRTSKIAMMSKSHPHLCGEYLSKKTIVVHCEEPPPLVRGIPSADWFVASNGRATPTCAGNTIW